MTVAIIIPAWNAERTLSETIQSALQQKSVSEIVVIDDGSTDGTATIAKAFGSRIRLYTIPNSGVSVARNLGIRETSSEWLVFLDSDDLLAKETIEQRLAVATRSRVDVVITDWQDFREDDDKQKQFLDHHAIDWDALEKDAEIACATHVWATTGAIMYRRDLVEKIGGFREDLPVIQDARFLFDAAYHGARFVHSRHLGAYYRIVDNSLSRRSRERFYADILHNGRQIEALWRSRGELSAAQRVAVAGIYDTAARGLLSAGSTRYYQAVEAQKAMGLPLPLHPRLIYPAAKWFGLSRARRLASLLGKA